MLAVSTLSYVAAFFPPGEHILKVERWAVQKIVRGAWNAFTSDFIMNFKSIGLPVQANSISDMSQASMVRSAASLPEFQNVVQEHLQSPVPLK